MPAIEQERLPTNHPSFSRRGIDRTILPSHSSVGESATVFNDIIFSRRTFNRVLLIEGTAVALTGLGIAATGIRRENGIQRDVANYVEPSQSYPPKDQFEEILRNERQSDDLFATGMTIAGAGMALLLTGEYASPPSPIEQTTEPSQPRIAVSRPFTHRIVQGVKVLFQRG